MNLGAFDWSIIIGYLVFALGVGVYYVKRASRNADEFYLAGRSLPWWVLGTSMVATTFAADTPLVITEYLRVDGIWKNWFWWSWLLSGLLGVFLFSRLWRRSGVLTDNEVLELRYSGKPAAFLRGYKAIYFGVIFNLLIMGWVLESMSSVLAVTLGVEKNTAMWALVGIALVYSLLSGFWGVVVTDVVQFFIAMVGAIVLAILAVNHVGGLSALLEKLDGAAGERASLTEQLARLEKAAQASGRDLAEDAEANRLREELSKIPPVTDKTTKLFPAPPKDASVKEFLLSPFFSVLVFILLVPWNHHGTDGGGYIIQRMMSAVDERHALLGTLWYNLANYALRVWPWIVVALVSLVLYSDLAGYEDVAGKPVGDKAGYPLVMREVLGPGLRGLLIVSFLAAFMSTIDTHLNWGSSYLVNDLYRRFLVRDRSQAHYVLIGRLITVILMVGAAALSTQVVSVNKVWELVGAMGAGIGPVLILRWFWWRTNAWSEVTALATSFCLASAFHIIAYLQSLGDDEVSYQLFATLPVFFGIEWQFHLQLLVIVPSALVIWLGVTLLTSPEPEDKLRAFYRRVQPGGFWGAFKSAGTGLEPVAKGLLVNFVGGLLFIYGATFGIGYFILLQPVKGAVCALLSLTGFAVIWMACLRHLGGKAVGR